MHARVTDEDRGALWPETALLLGAPPGDEPALSPPLRARIDVAARLFHDGVVTRILVSGVTSARLDETGPMTRALLAAGVEGRALVVDDGAHRTLASMRRARDLFELTRVVVVTNPFHMPRALFLARAVGLVAVGAPAVEHTLPSRRTRIVRLAREGGAISRALVDVFVLRLASRGVAERGAQGR